MELRFASLEGVEMNTFWKNRNVFVTGCTGLLGSELVAQLINSDANVVGLIRDQVPLSRLNIDGLTDKMISVHGCIEDMHTLERIIAEYEIDTVFHLAAQTIVGVASRYPLGTFTSNIQGTWNILEACRNVGSVKRIIVASSDKAYGEHSTLPYTESAALHGEHPYDVSKSCADLISRSYFVTYKLPVCITRCGNLFGPGDLNFNRIVPDTIRCALHNKPVSIRSDGSYIRDYFYVKDGAFAYLHLAEHMDRPNIMGEAFNFSNEAQISVLSLVKTILSVMNKTELEPIILNETLHEIHHQYLSAEKAKKLLEWKPRYSLEDGLRETIQWYRNFLK
jgi:CDP-glucose 4,6-dehydratase